LVQVSEKIRKIRIERHLSQHGFGKKIGMSGKTISAYETGKVKPSLRVLDKIAQNYGVSFSHLPRDKETFLYEKIRDIHKTLFELEKIFYG